MFLICSYWDMSNAAPGPETPDARPATGPDARDVEMLSDLAELTLELARAVQAQAVKAANAGDLDRAVAAETGFNRLALSLRRAVALKARLRQQTDEAAREADARHRRQRMQAAERRRAAAQGIGRAIAAEPDAETRERLTVDLWSRLADRIDADRPDTIPPIEVLILQLGHAMGLSRRTLARAFGEDGADAAPQRQGPAAAEQARWSPPPPPRQSYDYTPGRYVLISAAELGLEGDEAYNLNATTGEVFDHDGKLFRVLSTGPEPNDTGPPEATPPETGPPQPESVPPPLAGGGQGEGVGSAASGPPDDEAERRRQEHRLRQADAREFDLTLPDLP
jgi:hypothetical protein